jgi:multicomponent Na+:H+ antiporter subunit G
LLILIMMIITNPLATHSIARSAYFSGYRVKKGE